jgi:cytochrome c-type biogenesis protein CcsB
VTETYSQLSNHLVMSATIVYFLALLVHLYEWAQARQVVNPAETTRLDVVQRVTVAAPGSIPARDSHPVSNDLVPNEPALADSALADSALADSDDADREVSLARFARIGLSLTVLAGLLHLGGVVSRGIAAGRVPWGNMYEFAITGSLAVVLAYLVLIRLYQVRWLGLPVVVFATLILGLAMSVLFRPISPLVPALHSYWLMIHVSAAAIAGGAYTVGALASIVFLVKSRAEKGAADHPDRAHTGYIWRLPSAQGIDRVAYRVHAFAFPLWTFAVMAGAIWAEYAWGRYWGWDPKETWAFITWVAYAAYLHARATAGWQGKAAAYVALLGYATFLFNFVGINLFGSGLHSYSGM